VRKSSAPASVDDLKKVLLLTFALSDDNVTLLLKHPRQLRRPRQGCLLFFGKTRGEISATVRLAIVRHGFNQQCHAAGP